MTVSDSKNYTFGQFTYSVTFAERRRIGKEWNDIVWGKNHKDFAAHRLYYLKEGEGSLRLLHTGEVRLVPGRVYLIPALSILESNLIDKMDKYYIHFLADSPIFEMYRYISDKYSVPEGEMSEELFDTVVKNYAEDTDAARMRVQGAMNLIIADFLDGVGAKSSVASRFFPVLDYINENYTKHISLSELAAIMHVSKMYFSNAFKSAFNISPKQYILNKRLVESQRLLLDTDMSVKEIAYTVGFDNENYFSEFFSAKVGTPAVKFRNRRIQKVRESIL